MQRLASIDIGSQTIRLLVADVSPDGQLLPVLRNHAIIRLGEGMIDNGYLKNDPIERAVSCISHFIMQAQKLQTACIYAVATACVRAAKNSSFFLNAVFNKTGIMPSVLTGQEEAIMAIGGVGYAVNIVHGHMIVIDIGGGSTELICLYNNRITKTNSIPMGVIGLTEQYLVHDPPSSSDINELQLSIITTMNQHGLLKDLGTYHTILVGTAGTITTLAAMDLSMTEYNCDMINGYTLTLQRIKKLFNVMLSKSKNERGSMPGLEPDRSTVIIAGSAIVLEIMKVLNLKTLQVSDAGLLEGVLLQKIRT